MDVYRLARRDNLVHYGRDRTRATGGNVMPNYYSHNKLFEKQQADLDGQNALIILGVAIAVFFLYKQS